MKIEINITDDSNNKFDNGWVDGIDRCAICPNNPKNNPNASGICMCAIPSMYGPNRITC